MRYLLGLCILVLSGCKDTGYGDKVGQIIKLSKQGFVCKTWEAELIRGGLNNGSGASSTVFDFTIENEALVKYVQDALDKQYEVKIHYNMEFTTACRSDSGDHFLDSIERLNNQGHPLQVNEYKPDPKELQRLELLRQLKELEKQ